MLLAASVGRTSTHIFARLLPLDTEIPRDACSEDTAVRSFHSRWAPTDFVYSLESDFAHVSSLKWHRLGVSPASETVDQNLQLQPACSGTQSICQYRLKSGVIAVVGASLRFAFGQHDCLVCSFDRPRSAGTRRANLGLRSRLPGRGCLIRAAHPNRSPRTPRPCDRLRAYRPRLATCRHLATLAKLRCRRVAEPARCTMRAVLAAGTDPAAP